MNRVLIAFCVCLFLGQLNLTPVSGFQETKAETEQAKDDKPTEKEDKKTAVRLKRRFVLSFIDAKIVRIDLDSTPFSQSYFQIILRFRAGI